MLSRRVLRTDRPQPLLAACRRVQQAWRGMVRAAPPQAPPLDWEALQPVLEERMAATGASLQALRSFIAPADSHHTSTAHSQQASPMSLDPRSASLRSYPCSIVASVEQNNTLVHLRLLSVPLTCNGRAPRSVPAHA